MNQGSWGEYLKNLPFAKQFRDNYLGKYYAFSLDDLLNAILVAPNKNEQYAILQIFAYTRDHVYGSVPSDDKIFYGATS